MQSRALRLGIGLLTLVGAATEARGVCVTETSAAQFTSGVGCSVGDDSGGELLLPATLATEFSGVGLPAGWTTHEWTPGGSVSVGSGAATVVGYDLYPDPASYAAGRSLEFVATYAVASAMPLQAQPFQTIGFGSGSLPFDDFPLLAVGTFNQTGVSQGNVNALVWDTGANTPIPLHAVDGLPHRYRIDWGATTVTFSVDGVPITTQPHGVGATPMRPAISNFQTGNPLSVDWLHLSPYAAPCAHESAPLDSTAPATDWATLVAGATLPSGTAVTLETRSGNTVPVDGSWSAYQAVAGNQIASPRARYLQYRLTLASTDPDQTPAIEDVQVCYDLCTPSVETCDGLDNDCDDLVDEGNPGGALACTTGQLGLCAAGTTLCTGGAIQCVQNVAPASETCNGLDDDCDGGADDGNPGGGLGCSTGLQGVCAAGTTQCGGGAIQCVQNVAIAPETCDGLDNDCDGATDEGDPGGGGICDTGNPGICAVGIHHCQSGQIACVQVTTPAPAEACNGIDDNCNGSTDEGNPGGNAACSTGQPGVCAAGTTACSGGAIQCNQNTVASGEVCDGLDNDCDGTADEGDPGGGGACSSGQPGICAAGVQHCQSGQITCVQTNAPAPTEICNNLDDDCDGSTDEGDPGGGAACTTGAPGVCSAGVQHCTAGSVQCLQTNSPTAETCNSLDDDCDGAVDDGNPGGGGACSTGQLGICAPGTLQCQGGSVLCQPNQAAVPETCNGSDDNCNGSVDEGNPGGGVACATGQPGICAAGTTQCQSPTVACVPNSAPSAELCLGNLDENCNGVADEEPCALCAAADTVTSSTQTKTILAKLSSTTGQDKLTIKGTFVLPAPGLIDPATQAVTARITDAVGRHYLGTIPAGAFTGNSSGRAFKFSDTAPYAFDGMQRGVVKISGGDLVTTKYIFKARDLDLPAFSPGTGTITLRIGNRCFADDADVCTVSSSGTKAKCQ